MKFNLSHGYIAILLLCSSTGFNQSRDSDDNYQVNDVLNLDTIDGAQDTFSPYANPYENPCIANPEGEDCGYTPRIQEGSFSRRGYAVGRGGRWFKKYNNGNGWRRHGNHGREYPGKRFRGSFSRR